MSNPRAMRSGAGTGGAGAASAGGKGRRVGPSLVAVWFGVMSFTPLASAETATLPGLAETRTGTVWPIQAELPAASADVDALVAALRLDDVLAILQTEGTESALGIEEEMFPGQGGAAWAAKVQAIYDRPRMEAAFVTAFADAIGGNPEAVAASTEFFGSERGQRILALEIEGRRALLDDAVEDAAKLAWSRIEAEGGTRAEQLRRFAEVNDLIEANVQGALNSNLAFFRGLVDAGGALAEMGEEEMLASVWSQEEEVRQSTVEWLFPYLTLAYEPLPDADLDAYIAYSETPAGQAVNAALFAAYGAVFDGISLALGRAAGLQMQGQDI